MVASVPGPYLMGTAKCPENVLAPLQGKVRSGGDSGDRSLSYFPTSCNQKTPFPVYPEFQIEAENMVMEGSINQARDMSLMPGVGLCPAVPAGSAHSCYVVVQATLSL